MDTERLLKGLNALIQKHYPEAGDDFVVVVSPPQKSRTATTRQLEQRITVLISYPEE